MKYLIFGANGQVGYELTHLCQTDSDCVFLTRDQVDFSVPGEIQAQINRHQPDVVINAVAYTAVDKAESEPSLAMLINGVAVQELARACHNLGAWCIHYSTDYVFDGSSDRPYKESDPVSPLGIYGQTKLAGEQFIKEETDKYLILRTSWVYSWRGANFVKTMLRLAKDRDELNVVSDQHGCPSYACDIAKTTLDMVAKLDNKRLSGIYHLTGSDATSWHGFARSIFEKSGSSVTVNPIPTSEFPTPARRPAYSILDNSKLSDKFGLQLPGFNQSLDACLTRIALDE